MHNKEIAFRSASTYYRALLVQDKSYKDSVGQRHCTGIRKAQYKYKNNSWRQFCIVKELEGEKEKGKSQGLPIYIVYVCDCCLFYRV